MSTNWIFVHINKEATPYCQFYDRIRASRVDHLRLNFITDLTQLIDWCLEFRKTNDCTKIFHKKEWLIRYSIHSKYCCSYDIHDIIKCIIAIKIRLNSEVKMSWSCWEWHKGRVEGRWTRWKLYFGSISRLLKIMAAGNRRSAESH